MQGRVTDDFAANQRHQRQVAAVVKVPAPVADDFDFRDAMFDEHPFGFGNVEKQLMKILLVVAAQRTQRRVRAVLQRNDFRKFLEFEFNVE